MRLITLHHTNPLSKSDNPVQEITVNADLIYSVGPNIRVGGSLIRFSGGDMLPFDESPEQVNKILRSKNGKEK